jgi:hypothetical protein
VPRLERRCGCSPAGGGSPAAPRGPLLSRAPAPQSYDGALKGRYMAAAAQLDTRWVPDAAARAAAARGLGEPSKGKSERVRGSTVAAGRGTQAAPPHARPAPHTSPRRSPSPAPPPRSFPALFRLVKLWARTHECNDASQSTLNSTALMYMCVFFLQRMGVLPPLRTLCPPELTRVRVVGRPRPEGDDGAAGGAEEREEYEEVRLLDPRLRSLWLESHTLEELVAAVDARAGEVNDRKQRALAARAAGGSAAAAAAGDAHTAAALGALEYDLTQLLAGFLCYWEVPMAAWAEGRLRYAARAGGFGGGLGKPMTLCSGGLSGGPARRRVLLDR